MGRHNKREEQPSRILMECVYYLHTKEGIQAVVSYETVCKINTLVSIPIFVSLRGLMR